MDQPEPTIFQIFSLKRFAESKGDHSGNEYESSYNENDGDQNPTKTCSCKDLVELIKICQAMNMRVDIYNENDEDKNPTKTCYCKDLVDVRR